MTRRPPRADAFRQRRHCHANPVNRLDVNGDVALSGKHAFRSSDPWLRLNQDGAFTSGTHTPGLFAPGP